MNPSTVEAVVWRSIIDTLHAPIFLSRETKLWEQTANAGTIDMPNNEGMRRQPPLGEVGGAKSLLLKSVELARKRKNAKRGKR